MNDSTAPVEAQPTEPQATPRPDGPAQTADASEGTASSPTQAAASPVSAPEPPASHTQPMPPTPPTPYGAPTEPLPHAAPSQGYPAQAAYPAYPAQPQAAPQPWPGQQGAPSYAPYPPVPYARSPYGAAKSSRPGLVIAVISLIVSGLALLAVFGMGVFMFGGPAGPGGPAGTMAPLTGKVPSVSPSTSLLGERLSSEISVRLEDDGWIVDEVKCPTTPKVAQGVVSVCHATMDEGDWAVVVYFEDDQGTYTLNVF